MLLMEREEECPQYVPCEIHHETTGISAILFLREDTCVLICWSMVLPNILVDTTSNKVWLNILKANDRMSKK